MTVHHVLVAGAIVLAGGAAVADGVLPVERARLVTATASDRDRVSAVALAEAIAAGRGPRVFDLRSGPEFDAFHVPSATHMTFDALAAVDLPRSTPIVLYADGAAPAVQGWGRLRMRGYRDVAFLREGVYEWIVRVHEPALAADATPAERAEFEHRAALSRYFGGQPRLDVPRAEVPAGYWTAGGDGVSRPSVAASLLVAAIRRRGC